MNIPFPIPSRRRIARLAIAGLSALAVVGLGAEERLVRRIPRVIVFPAQGNPSRIPFGVSGEEIGYEQVYSGRLFPEVATIREIAFATAPGYGNPRPQYEEPADRLLEQRNRARNLPGAPDRTVTGRRRLPAVGGPTRTCTQLRIALGTTGKQPGALSASENRLRGSNSRVVIDAPRFDYRAQGNGSFDLVFPVRLDPPFVYRPERDGNLVVEITIGSEMGALPIYLEAGKSPFVGSIYRIPSSPAALSYPGRGLHTRFVVDELVFERKKEPGAAEPKKEAGPEDIPPAGSD